MSYRDPYSGYAADASGRYQNNQPEYTDSNSYPPHQTYDNMGEDEYRRYDLNPQSYRDERQPEDYQPDYSYGGNHSNYPPPQRGLTQKSTTSGLSKKSKPSVAVVPVRKQESGFEQGEFTPTPRTRK